MEVSEVRLGFQEFLITWIPPSSENSSIVGYQVFYESSTGNKRNITVMNADNVTLTELALEELYVVTVLSFGVAFVLPSVHCKNITIVTGKDCLLICKPRAISNSLAK